MWLQDDNRTSGVAKATFLEGRSENQNHGSSVPGMFSRKTFEIWVPEMQFQAVWGDILENFNDYKVHQRHDFLWSQKRTFS
jgi:hypothetical protein